MTITPISNLPNHTAHLRQIAAEKPGRRGPKPSDKSDMIGQQQGRLTVVDVLPIDENRRTHVICLCSCGKASSPRDERFLSGESASCRCLKVENFKGFQARRAENLSAAVCRDVFITSAMTGNWKGSDLVVAKAHNLPSHRIRAVVARHQQALLEKHGDAIRANPLISRKSLDKNLHPAEFNWVAKHVQHAHEPLGEIEWSDLSIDEQAMILNWSSAAPSELAAAA